MANLEFIAGSVSPEVAEAVDAYSRTHGVTRSHAVHVLISRGLGFDDPPAPKRGRPVGWRKNKHRAPD